MNFRKNTISISALLLAIFTSAAFAHHTDSHKPTTVKAAEGWVREPIAERPMTGAYVTLTNPGTEKRALIAVTSPSARVCELHRVVMKDDRMQMEQVQKIEIPAGGTTELKPGGLHIMLIDLVKPLKAGDRVRMELTFDDGTRTIDVPVRAGEGAHASGHH